MLRLLPTLSYRSLLSRRTFSSSPSSPPPPPTPLRKSRLSPYLAQLHARYPHTSPSSLTASFLLLHELTAVLPLFLLFGGFSLAGVGTSLVAWTVAETDTEGEAGQEGGVVKKTVRGWLVEAEEKAERVGRRYGVFGWEKESKEERKVRREREKREKEEGEGVVAAVEKKKERDLRVSGEVANLVAAYLVTKALLPLRILISLRLTPTLANGVVGRYKAWRAASKTAAGR